MGQEALNEIVWAKPGPLSILELVGFLALFVLAAKLVAWLDRWILSRISEKRGSNKGD
jgi:hypothetical protein